VFSCVTAALCAVSSFSGRRYHYVHEQKTWAEAQSYCREKYTDLATAGSMEDMELLIKMVKLGEIVGINSVNPPFLSGFTQFDSINMCKVSWKILNSPVGLKWPYFDIICIANHKKRYCY